MFLERLYLLNKEYIMPKNRTFENKFLKFPLLTFFAQVLVYVQILLEILKHEFWRGDALKSLHWVALD